MPHTADLWSETAKCRTMSIEEADAMFWPGSGGKPTAAKAFCSDCPMIKFCLMEAIEKGLTGFWAGTTDTERTQMARYLNIKVKPINLNTFVFGNAMDSTPRRLKESTVADTVDYLNTIDNPMYY